MKYNLFCDNVISKEVSRYVNKDGSISLFGRPFFIYNSFSEFVSLLNEIILEDQYYAKKFLREDSIIIDAGANLGVFSVFAANLSKKGKVFSFEPVKKTFSFLSKNTEQYKNIQVINLGLGDSNITKKIFVGNYGTGGNSFEDDDFSNHSFFGNYEDANIISLDSYVFQNKIERIDFIKIDTEGYERKILEGAKETINKFHPVISMSAYHHKEDKKELPKIICKICPNYICELHKNFEEDFVCYYRRDESKYLK